MIRDPIRRTGSFLANRLLSGIWAPMLAAVTLACLLAAGLALLDRAGLSAWVAGLGWPLAFGMGAADDILDTVLAVQVAVLTLYFSITLLVLTLAAQSLGARLIERWIARVEIRATLAQWAALVAFSLVAQLFLSPEGGGPVPRATVLVALALTLFGIGWLGFAYHRLARTAHVDTSIADLGRDFATDRQDWGLTDGPDPDAAPGRVLRAWTSGYLGGFDRDRLIDVAHEAGGRIAVRVPDGGFVVEGDPLAHLWDGDDRMEAALRDTCEIAAYRADRPTGPFSLALLVEIAARALSPSVNDHQTAATCCDWIGHGLAARLGAEAGPEGWFVDADGDARLFVPESGVVAQALPFLAALHRAARPHPLVAERLVAAYRAALARAAHASDRRRLSALIEEVARAPAGEGFSAIEGPRMEAAVDRAREGRAAPVPIAAE